MWISDAERKYHAGQEQRWKTVKASLKKRKGKRRASQPNHSRQRKARHTALREFWAEFYCCISDGARIFMLKQWAEKKFEVSNKIPFERTEEMRSYWDQRKNRYFALKGKPCEACGKKATVRHHIIQLKNGGGNHGLNIIRLCNGCHKAIHPWMKVSA